MFNNEDILRHTYYFTNQTFYFTSYVQNLILKRYTSYIKPHTL